MCLSSKNFLICFYEYVHIVCIFARVHMYACVPWRVWRLEHNLTELISLSSTMLVPGIKLESSGLVVSAFAPWTSHCVEGYSRVCRCTWRPKVNRSCLSGWLFTLFLCVWCFWCMQCPQRTEGVIRYSRTGLRGGCKLQCGHWELWRNKNHQ